MTRTLWIALALAWLTGHALAADAKNGKALARDWCATCHLVERKGAGGDGAPPFESIANDPARTDSYLRSWLADPHPAMPNLQLSRNEIDDLVAYLQSLKKKSK